MMRELLSDLAKRLPDLSPQLAQAARHILDNPNEVAITSMRNLAKRAGVTSPTMVRLAKQLDYVSYETFRDVFRDNVATGGFEHRATALQRLANADGEAAVVGAMAKTTAANVERLFSDQDIEQFCKIADVLRTASNIYVIGSGAMHFMASYFQYVGRMALPHLRAPRATGAPLMEGVVAIEPNDVAVVLSISPYSAQTIEAAELAKSQGAIIVALTDSNASPLVRLADHAIVAPSETPQYFPSVVGIAAAIESILAVITSKADAATVERIRKFSVLRKR